jgi:hypothetical protein
LRRDGLDGSWKFTPSAQLKQVDLYVARNSADASNAWYFGILSHVRAFTLVVLLATITMFLLP